MQKSSANVIDEMEQSKDPFMTADVMSQGKVPKWLEDMSNNCNSQTHSLSDYYSKLYLDTGNMDLPTTGEEASSEMSRKSTGSSRTSSAQHGRRAFLLSNSQHSTPDKKISDHTQDYFVPNLNSIDLNKVVESNNKIITKEQYYKNKTDEMKVEKNPTTSKKYNKQEVGSYSPSIFDKENGRRSQVESLDDSLLYNDLISSMTTILSDTKKSQTNPVPDRKKHSITDSIHTQTEHTQTNVDNKISDNLIVDNKIVSKMLTTNLNSDSSKSFDEFYKHKLRTNSGRKVPFSPNKRMRYKKFKYKQGSVVVPKKEVVKKIDSNEEIFIIPELPRGTRMTINILSTWGDKFYVGLNGIELFSSDGKIVQVKKISAPDVSLLPECLNDPRIVLNLLDGINRTHDDTHLWLAPFDDGESHNINIEFEKNTQLAMMRIWNYNKSRIHSFRGARYIVITLDDVPIFKGEIAQACGSIDGSIESFGDTILFTTEESILEKISRHDEAFITLISQNSDTNEKIERPSTATKPEEPMQRPFTQAVSKPQANLSISVHRIDLVFILNWGKPDSIGLTGLEVFGENDTCLSITEKNLSCNFKGPLNKLLDGENLTTDPKHMWTVKYNIGRNVIISINFETYTKVSGIRLWNYNENMEKTFVGVRILKIFFDNQLLQNPFTKDCSFILRRAPGNIHYDYVQEILFTNLTDQATSEAIYNFSERNNYIDESFEHPIMPEGFVFQIVIYTTWGDQYYVGLNGIELYDQLGRMILLTESNICAHPESVNVLPGVSGDVRTPDKLIDGVNDGIDGAHSWLAPVIPKCLNRIYIVMDQPISISVIKLWNYFKSPIRGVKEFGILVDDLLVYNGVLDKATENSSVAYRSILFTSNSDVIRKEMATLVKHSIDSQGTVLMNDKLRMTTGGSLPGVDQSLRPFTSVSHVYRGRTSQSN